LPFLIVGLKTTTQTNEDGIYVLCDLHPGNYQVTVEKQGFRQVILTSDAGKGIQPGGASVLRFAWVQIEMKRLSGTESRPECAITCFLDLVPLEPKGKAGPMASCFFS
jgi:hypothetical protein